jgi:hypothetical protein
MHYICWIEIKLIIKMHGMYNIKIAKLVTCLVSKLGITISCHTSSCYVYWLLTAKTLIQSHQCSVCMGFVVDKVAIKQAFSRIKCVRIIAKSAY